MLPRVLSKREQQANRDRVIVEFIASFDCPKERAFIKRCCDPPIPLTYPEIGAVLGISRTSAATIERHALNKIRRVLDVYRNEDGEE